MDNQIEICCKQGGAQRTHQRGLERLLLGLDGGRGDHGRVLVARQRVVPECALIGLCVSVGAVWVQGRWLGARACGLVLGA